MTEARPIKALVVDDAAFMRKQLVEVLSKSDDIEVVAVARHGAEALEAIKNIKPDVITLDVDMPVMDGLTTIKHIMVKNPVPVVMVSGLADHGRVTFEALRLGAIDFFPKPSGTISHDIGDSSQELVKTLKLAAGSNPKVIKRAIATNRKTPLNHGQNQNVDGVVVVLALQGAVSGFIRLFSALEGLPNVGFMCVQDISSTVLSAYTRELSSFLECVPFSGSEVVLKARQCMVMSMDGLASRVEYEKKDSHLVVSGMSSDLNQFISSMAEKIGKRLCLVILGGQVPKDTSFLKKVLSTGGTILALEPGKCACNAFPSYIENEGIGNVATGELDLWERIKGFSRRLFLQKLKQHKQVDGQ